MNILSEVYKIIRDSVAPSSIFSEKRVEYNENLKEDGSSPFKAFEYRFLPTLGLTFRDLRPFLEELDRLELIKFSGQVGWEKDKTPYYWVHLFKYVDPETVPEYKNDAVSTQQVIQKSKVILPNLPANLKWEEITIRFFNNQEVMIKAGGQTINSNFEVMGFIDKKRKLPNVQWKLLETLSKKHGEISWQNNKGLSAQQINSIKKRKQKLSEGLQSIFQIKDDPFSDYKKGKAYKIKINLTPINNETDDGPNTEMRSYLDEECPQVDDREAYSKD